MTGQGGEHAADWVQRPRRFVLNRQKVMGDLVGLGVGKLACLWVLVAFLASRECLTASPADRPGAFVGYRYSREAIRLLGGHAALVQVRLCLLEELGPWVVDLLLAFLSPVGQILFSPPV
jgi:hypothetical protein